MDKLKNKIPQVRFPEFKDEWKEFRLSELMMRISKNNKDEEFSIEEILSLSSTKGIVDRKELLGNTYDNVNHKNYIKTRLNDLVYGKSISADYPFGLFKANDCRDGLLSTLYFTFKVNESTSSKFLDIYFSYHNRANNFLKKYVLVGDRYITADANYILSGKIFIPEFKEQQKTAHFFSIIDKKLTQLQEKKTALELYKKGMMQQLFCPHYDSDDLDDEQDFAKDSQEKNKGNKENQKKSKFRLRFKDDNGQDFPDWEEKKLGEVCEFSKGKGISKKDISENGKSECIRYGELYTHYKEVISEIISKTNIESKNLVFSKGNDVIIPASGEDRLDIATASCIINSGIAIGGDLNIIRSNNNGIFLSYYLNSVKKIEIANLAQGVSVVHLYSSQLSPLSINLPTLPEQTKIANFLSKIDDKINTVTEKIEQTKAYKKGLLQQMFCN